MCHSGKQRGRDNFYRQSAKSLFCIRLQSFFVCLFSRKLKRRFPKKVISYLKTLPKVCVVCPLEEKYRAQFEEEGFTSVERVQLSSPRYQLDTWQSRLPSGCQVDTIDEKNFGKCMWHAFILSCYGSCERFFTNGVGFCLLNQEKIICESYAVIGDNLAEIGIVTGEEYRGQNLGTIMTALMLDYCKLHNLESRWSCDVNNLASFSIAKKLGFAEDCRYFFLKWTAPQL